MHEPRLFESVHKPKSTPAFIFISSTWKVVSSTSGSKQTYALSLVAERRSTAVI